MSADNTDLEYNEYNEEDTKTGDYSDKPSLQARESQQRGNLEKRITKEEFAKYRGLIKKRLSDKQRMPFDELISRNIRAGLTDEFYERKPMERSKKILQLNRRLSHRPQPSDIRNDEELPLDLKKADSEYVKIYKYRDRSRDSESSDSEEPLPPPRNRTTSDPNPSMTSSNHTGPIWKHTIDNPLDWKFGQRSSTKDLQIRGIIPEQYADVIHGNKSLEDAKQEWELYKKESSSKIKNKINLKFRPTKKDLRDRGLIYEEIEMKELRKTKQRNIKSLSMKLKQRIDPNEATERNIINKSELFSNIDYGQHKIESAMKRNELRLKMNSSINQRSNKAEIISRGIVAPEFLNPEHDYHSAKHQIRENRNSVKQTIHSHFLNKINKTDSDNSEESDSDSDSEEFVSFLDRMKQERNKHRKSIAEAHRRRPTQEDLIERGILLANPNGVYMSNEYANTLRNTGDNTAADNIGNDGSEDTSTQESSSDDSEDAYPTFLDRMREEKERTKQSLEIAHRRRPSQQDLEDSGVVAKGYFENMQVALTNKKARRKSFTTELASFFQQRPDIAQMLTKGLVAAEFIGMDSFEMANKRKAIKNTLNKKLNKKRRPTMDELELRGIVPVGYFNDAQKAVIGKHTRRMTAEKDLSNFLGNRMNPRKMMEKGFIPQQHFDNIMGVASVFAQKMVKDTIQHYEQEEQEQETEQETTQEHRRKVSSGIGDIVLDLPQYDIRISNNWTQNLYESLLNSLQFSEISQQIELQTESSNNTDWLRQVIASFEKFERLYHTKMNALQNEKCVLYSEIVECETEESEALSILTSLISEHSLLEQKIRPQMKMLLHKMTLVEHRINLEKNTHLRTEYEKELNYYDTYITELKNVFIHTNNIRSKYQNSIRTLIEHKKELDTTLANKNAQIHELKLELNTKLKAFNKLFMDGNAEARESEEKTDEQTQSKYDPLASDPITDLNDVLDDKNKNIDHNLDLLSFRLSTIPTIDYAFRVIELCQLSYIYSNDRLKSFFEWFIRFAVQSFVEINYAHTCFTTQNMNAINHEINQLKSIQFIAELVSLPTPNDNKTKFETILYDYLTLCVSYLELLPSNNDNVMTSNNNIDHESVIFHVARYLTSNFVFAQNIISQTEEQNVVDMAQNKVYEWIKAIIQSTNSSFQFSKDYNEIENKTNKPRNIINATRFDSIARVKPTKAAAIVMGCAYDIYVNG